MQPRVLQNDGAFELPIIRLSMTIVIIFDLGSCQPGELKMPPATAHFKELSQESLGTPGAPSEVLVHDEMAERGGNDRNSSQSQATVASDAESIEVRAVVFNLHNVLDRFYRAGSPGGRKEQALVLLCSHIGLNSPDIQEWALSTLHNTCAEATGDKLLDLIIITRQRTCVNGKLDVVCRVFNRAQLLIVDDNVDVFD
ncbi:hypothetical protein AK812_SmicGene40886 [Symbiodinium microadriaticum]|uniref:Uncharacterized protein n=1 Tax=Symbiodinium microadriaticum TaxID=2951 RepID=A0A1Q9C7J6_SYMMI|nr:hypothetical protein AK812_SmicGene40886 [Symbiodinium microadriaticum]